MPRKNRKLFLRYVFLRLYSNEELLLFLNHQLENGLILDHCRGNFLYFRRCAEKGLRLSLVTALCSKPKAEEDDDIAEYLAIAKKKGWTSLCVGDYESLLPMRRRLYFYTKNKEAAAPEPDAAVDFQNAHRAYHATLRASIAWLLLAAVCLVSTVPFMAADGVNLAMVVLNGALLSAACTAITLWMNRRILYRHVTKNAVLPEGHGQRLRRCELFRLGSMGAVLAGILLLLFS